MCWSPCPLLVLDEPGHWRKKRRGCFIVRDLHFSGCHSRSSRAQRSDARSLWQEIPQRAGPLILLRLVLRNKGRIRVEQLLTPYPTQQAVGMPLPISKAVLIWPLPLEQRGVPWQRGWLQVRVVAHYEPNGKKWPWRELCAGVWAPDKQLTAAAYKTNKWEAKIMQILNN